MNSRIYSILYFFLFSFTIFAQDNSVPYAQTIKQEDLKAHLIIIASDSFEGRGTAEKGQKLAASYIAKQFQNIGLLPVVKYPDSLSYFQTFSVYKRGWQNPYLKVDKQQKQFLKDFFSIGNPSFHEEQEIEMVFGGYGDDSKLNVKNLDYKDKGVLLFLGRIEEKDSLEYLKKMTNLIITSNNNRKFKNLLERGAKAIFIIAGKNEEEFERFLDKYKCDIEGSEINPTDKNQPTNNVFFVSPSLGSEILGISAKKMRMLQSKDSGYTRSDLKEVKPKNIVIKASRTVEALDTENVLGFIEGTDKKEEVIVLTAHYDHEGIKCGVIYNGADDDGSGTVTILELAQAFSLAKSEGKGPRRSILFMTVTGEEKGLLGSKYYVENPVFPLSQTVVNLNIDMIGRIDKFHEDENYVYLIGSNKLSRQLHNLSEEVNLKYSGINLDYKYNAPNDPNRFYYRSDHYNFAKNNIPVIFYFSGTHEDYHKPTDDVEKILFGKIEKTARLIFHTAWELANREERIKVDAGK